MSQMMPQKIPQIFPRVVPKWFPSGPQEVPSWSPSGPHMVPKWSPSVPGCTRLYLVVPDFRKIILHFVGHVDVCAFWYKFAIKYILNILTGLNASIYTGFYKCSKAKSGWMGWTSLYIIYAPLL